MDRLFVVLFVLFLQSMASRAVEEPTDVVFRCHNMSNVLEWSYRETVPGLRFRVDYKGYSSKFGELWVDPPDLRADISFLSDVSDSYLITVTAVLGRNESDAPEILFSYDPNAPLLTHKCFLDFPPVTVTDLGDDSVLLSFQHPAFVYNINSSGSQNTNRKRRRSPDYETDEQLPEFTYDVEFINETTKEKRFSCVESVCEEEISVDPAQKIHCLMLSGNLLNVKVKGTQHCTQPSKPKKDYIYIFVIVGLLLGVSAIALIFCMIYQKKTKPTTPLPRPLTFTKQLKITLGLVQEPVSKAEVTPTSPTRLLPSDGENEEKDFPPAFSSTTDDVRLPIVVPADDEGVCDVVKVESDEEPGYAKNFEEDETEESNEAPSGYEKRQVFVELAPDEQAEGYRG